MHLCTFETAKKLKAAGFSQPNEIKFWQVWYDDSGTVVEHDEGCIFAPTVTDILREVPGLSCRYHSFLNEWQASFNRAGVKHSGHDPENAAETCANAYFSIYAIVLCFFNDKRP